MTRWKNACTALVALVLVAACGTGKDKVADTVAADQVSEVAQDALGEHETVTDAPGPGETLTDDEIGTPDVCQSNCEGKQCGDDGCGGTCGDCSPYEVCSTGSCTAPTSCSEAVECSLKCWPTWGGECLDNCCGVELGTDACAHAEEVVGCLSAACSLSAESGDEGCVDEALTAECNEMWAQCEDCLPDCEEKECGSDGCDGSCGECGPGFVCKPNGLCYPDDAPDCTDKECGPDGFGGSCGKCEEGFQCTSEGECKHLCIEEGDFLGPEEDGLPCCDGLTALPHFKMNSGDDCDAAECCFWCDQMEGLVCTACGDGVCGPGENACNCEDCPCYPLLDSDNDGIVDVDDNCPDVYNPVQSNCEGDGLGDACDEDDDNDLSKDEVDCAPCDATKFPGQVEWCNGEDDDCDGMIDEDFPDLGDSCEPPSDPDGCDPFAGGHWECSVDGLELVCVPNWFPGGVEICDGVDNNCDGQVDEGYPDTDKDGLADCVDLDDDNDGDNDETDCAPLDSNIHHEATEQCNGVDDNCDGEMDEEPVFAAEDCPTEGVCSSGVPMSCLNGMVVCNLEAVVGWYEGDYCDGLDNNCNGQVDEQCEFDCAPLDPETYPGAPEKCDGIDNNCNGQIDEGYPDTDMDGLADCLDPDDDNDGVDDADDNCPTVENPDQKDCDGDGIGFACDEDVGQCDEPPYEPCDPQHPEFFPGAQEICDGLDNNCNGDTDEGFPDSDGDGIADCVDLD